MKLSHDFLELAHDSLSATGLDNVKWSLQPAWISLLVGWTLEPLFDIKAWRDALAINYELGHC